MNSRERILITLEHREPDRVPIGFESHGDLTERLMDHFGVEDRLALFHAMGIDGFSVNVESYVYPKYVGPEFLTLEDGTTCDFWGIDFRQRHLPLGFAETPADLDNYQWPSADWFTYDHVKEQCLKIKELGIPTVGGEGGCGIYHTINMRGYEQTMIDPLLNPDLTHAYMKRMGDFFVDWNERWLSAAEGEFDIFRCGDEIGGNETTHCSPEIWREFHKPQLKRVFAVAKKHGLKIWFHCCGCCRPVLEDLIEIGVDLWDSVPGYVAGNDQPALKRELGDRLAFIGGVNTLTVVRCGTPMEVREEVKRCLDIFAPGGGYILGGGHGLFEDTPIENVLAMFESAVEYGVY